MGCGLASGAGAQSLPDDTLDQRAREILAIHCAPCREVGARARTEPRPTRSRRDPKSRAAGQSRWLTRLYRDDAPARPRVGHATGPSRRSRPCAPGSRACRPAGTARRDDRRFATSAAAVRQAADGQTDHHACTRRSELQLYADRARYKRSAIEVRSPDPHHRSIAAYGDISIDRVRTRHRCIFAPTSDFATKDPRSSAHFGLSLPAPERRLPLPRVKEKGRERVVALCTRAAGLIDGITHDFERQRFQELGPYSGVPRAPR